MTEHGHRDFYRITYVNPPTLWDFTSGRDRGTAEPLHPRHLAVWDGISVFSTLNQARRKQRLSPILGAFIARIRVPTDGSVRFERTLGGDGHHTIWGEPAYLLSLVVSVEPVQAVHWSHELGNLGRRFQEYHLRLRHRGGGDGLRARLA